MRLILGQFGTGWKPSLPDFRDKPLALARFGGAPVPSHRDDRAAMPPVYNQGQTNSCCGHGPAGAMHYMRRKQGLADFEPSPLFIYWNSRDSEGTADYDGGSQVRDAIRATAKLGACPETAWPFAAARVNTKPTPETYGAAATDVVKAYAAVPHDIDAIRTCIAHDLPVVFGFSIYREFEGDDIAKTGMLTLPGFPAVQLGGHCVLACGYSDKSKVVICRNSWGPKWGDAGYFYMPYDYITNPGLAADFWQIDVVG